MNLYKAPAVRLATSGDVLYWVEVFITVCRETKLEPEPLFQYTLYPVSGVPPLYGAVQLKVI